MSFDPAQFSDAQPELTLVTGATGVLGAQVLPRLRAAGDRVRVILRPGSPKPEGCEALYGDLNDPHFVRQALRSVRSVYHLAAITRKWLPDRRAFDRVNVEAAVQLARLAGEEGVERLVHVSSFTVYGPSPDDDTHIDESSSCAAGRLQNDYQRSKHRAHEELSRMAERSALPVVIACPGVLYGPVVEQRPNPIADLMRKQLMGRLAVFPNSDRRWTLAWTADVADGLYRARHLGRPGQSYLLGGCVTSLHEVFEWIREQSGRSCPRSAPLWPFLCLGRAAEITGTISRRTPRISAAALRFMTSSWTFSSEKASRELGYRITPLATALRTLWKDLHDRRLVTKPPPAAVPAA